MYRITLLLIFYFICLWFLYDNVDDSSSTPKSQVLPVDDLGKRMVKTCQKFQKRLQLMNNLLLEMSKFIFPWLIASSGNISLSSFLAPSAVDTWADTVDIDQCNCHESQYHPVFSYIIQSSGSYWLKIQRKLQATKSNVP